MALVLLTTVTLTYTGYFTTTDEIFQWAKDQNVNLQDKVVIVTGTQFVRHHWWEGGYSGVGKEVVRTLAKLRARLYLVGRHKDICEPFAQRLADETHAVIECQYVDLSDLASVEVLTSSLYLTPSYSSSCGSTSICPYTWYSIWPRLKEWHTPQRKINYMRNSLLPTIWAITFWQPRCYHGWNKVA